MTAIDRAPHSVADLAPGDHLCCLYETEEEHRAVVVPFLRRGLERGEKVAYIVDARTADTILGYLRDDGLDVDPYLARGQLRILTAHETYFREGGFDPDGMIGLLRAETEQALAEGHPALRVMGEMTWALRGIQGSERLIEYEAKLNGFLPGSRCLAMCQYDCRRFDPKVLIDVLRTHPIAVVGTAVYDNGFYVPTEDVLGGDRAGSTLRNWLAILAERHWAGEALRASEQRYRTLFENMLEGFAYCKMLFDDRGRPEDWIYLGVNKAFERLTGLKNVVGRKGTEAIPGIRQSNPELFEIYGRVASTGNPESFEVYLQALSMWLAISVFSPEKEHFVAVFENITDRKQAEEERERLIRELRSTLAEVKTLRGLLPICASCKRIRDEKGEWRSVERYVQDHSHARFSHGLCPECGEKLYPDFFPDLPETRKP